MALSFSFLSTGPRVEKRDDKLIANTSGFQRILNLGAYEYCMEVDPAVAEVVLRSRSWWGVRRERRIPFKIIRAVTYGYRDVAPSRNFTFAHDSMDVFETGLLLWTGENVELFTFSGDGTFTNDGPWPDWTYWKDFSFDLSGTQEKESRVFVQLLCKMIGVTLEVSSSGRDDEYI